MPAPTVECSVCGKTVLKSRTRHVGDGNRACKTHDGVMGIAEKTHASSLADLAAKRDAEKRHRHKEHTFKSETFSTELRCNICNHPAVRVGDLMFESMVASREMEIEGTPGAMFTDPLGLVKKVKSKFPDKVGLLVYTREELGDKYWAVVLNGVRRELKEDVQMFGFAGICTGCVRKLNLPDKMANLPQPSIETMLMLGDSVNEVLTEIVEKRRENSNQ